MSDGAVQRYEILECDTITMIARRQFMKVSAC